MPLTDSTPRTLSLQEIGNIAYANGWRNKNSLAKAIRVVMAESSGRTNADNGIAAGIFQINYRAHKQYDRTKLYEPSYNARAARRIWLGAGGQFERDWVASISKWGAAGYLPEADKVAEDISKHGPTFAGRGGMNPGGVFSGIEDLGIPDIALSPFKIISQIWAQIGSVEFWKRAGLFLLGFGALGFALVLAGKEFAQGARNIVA